MGKKQETETETERTARIDKAEADSVRMAEAVDQIKDGVKTFTKTLFGK